MQDTQPGREGEAARRPEILSRGESRRRNWLREPKAAVWLILAVAIVFGGWRKLRSAWRARKAVARLEDPRVTPEEVEAAAEHGRTAVWELLRIFSSTNLEPLRQAAGRALARLWLLDQLVAEEEQAIVRRGYTVMWNARRRYPRALWAEIPIGVNFEVPFLDGEAGRVRRESGMVASRAGHAAGDARRVFSLGNWPRARSICHRAPRLRDEWSTSAGLAGPSANDRPHRLVGIRASACAVQPGVRSVPRTGRDHDGARLEPR